MPFSLSPPCIRQTQTATSLGPDAVERTARAPLEELRRAVPCIIRDVGSGQTIAVEGEPSGQVTGIVEGLVRCFRLTASGRRHISRFAGAGSLIGLGLLGVQRHSTEAIGPGQVVIFRAPAVEAAFEQSPQVRSAILAALAEELIRRERVQLRLGRLDADQRVADFLLEMSEPDAGPVAHPIPMPRADIADHLGVTIETVSRALHRFERLGLIDLPDLHHYRLLKPHAVERLIEYDDYRDPASPRGREPDVS